MRNAQEKDVQSVQDVIENIRSDYTDFESDRD